MEHIAHWCASCAQRWWSFSGDCVFTSGAYSDPLSMMIQRSHREYEEGNDGARSRVHQLGCSSCNSSPVLAMPFYINQLERLFESHFRDKAGGGDETKKGQQKHKAAASGWEQLCHTQVRLPNVCPLLCGLPPSLPPGREHSNWRRSFWWSASWANVSEEEGHREDYWQYIPRLSRS